MHEIDYSVPLFFSHVRGTLIPITPQLVVDVLRVPRIEIPNYPSYERLRTVSRNELMSAFCERPFFWGERLFTPCRPFARFMNMVMTFVLHPLSYYNSITEPRARFLLSLLEHLTIDFPSHFILSIIDVHLDSASHDKFIFPSAITRILCPLVLSIHIRSFLFFERCDFRGHHGATAAHGCSPRYILYEVVSGERLCRSY